MTEEKCPHNMIEEKICKKCVTDWNNKNCDCPCHSSPHHSWEELIKLNLSCGCKYGVCTVCAPVLNIIENIIIPQVKLQAEQKQWEKMTNELKVGIEKAIKEVDARQLKFGLLDSEAGFIAGLRHVAKEAGISLPDSDSK